MSLTDSLSRRLVAPLLIIILAIAAGLRFYNLDWDDGTFAHPDERSTIVYFAPTIRWPAELSTVFDPRASTLNPFWDTNEQRPRSYTYGHFPLYTLVLVAHGLNSLGPLTSSFLPPGWTQFMATAPSPLGFALIGRALVALADLFTVYLVFLLGRRLYGVWGGLLAAALSALTVLQIQLAHFFAVDPVSTAFTLLALYGAMLMYDRQSRGAAIVTGIGIGLAVASKYSALPVAFAPLIAAYLASTRRGPRTRDQGPGAGELQAPTPDPRPPVSMFGLAMLALAVAFVIFAVTSPFVLLDFENFKYAVVEEQGNMVSGAADFPFTRQFRNTWPYVYFIDQQLRWGMGWPLGLLALGGTLWVIIKAVRGKAQPGEWFILCWIILYFGPTGLFLAKFMRYMIPVVPLFTLFGAGLVVAIWRIGQAAEQSIANPVSGSFTVLGETNEPTGAQSHLLSDTGQPGQDASPQPSNLPSPLPPRSSAPLWQKFARTTAIALTIIALGGAAFWSLAFVNGVYGTDHTWFTFARWTYANVPDGACIAREHWDEGIPASIDEPGGSPLAHRYFQPELPMYEEDTQQKYENLRNTLMNCDYIALASNRLWRTIPSLPQRYPMSTRYYQALFSGELGFEPIYSVETPPRLGPFVIEDQSADESFTVYDHPKPIMFKKTRQLSQAEWDAILDNTWQTAIPGYVGSPTLLMRLRGIGNTSQAIPLPLSEREGKSLMLDTPVDRLPIVNDFHWNSLANNSTIIAVLFWWLVVMLIGVLALPLTLLLFKNLPDRGYALSKSLALLLVSYFVWLNSSLGWLSNTVTTAIIGLIFLGGFSFWATTGNRPQIWQY
ncbi:MAG: glycosyltransferase family 39 protein, partial [Chloroflexi bacterium]|nr:glycosyltransferase family 39 protein [Chloroflexota bacterium]